jgi:hypothetical protein
MLTCCRFSGCWPSNLRWGPIIPSSCRPYISPLSLSHTHETRPNKGDLSGKKPKENARNICLPCARFDPDSVVDFVDFSCRSVSPPCLLLGMQTICQVDGTHGLCSLYYEMLVHWNQSSFHHHLVIATEKKKEFALFYSLDQNGHSQTVICSSLGLPSSISLQIRVICLCNFYLLLCPLRLQLHARYNLPWKRNKKRERERERGGTRRRDRQITLRKMRERETGDHRS